MEAYLKKGMEYLKKDMEGLKEGGTKPRQESPPNDEKHQETSKEEDIHQESTLEKEQMNPTISCIAMAGITTPQTLKIEGHIKKKKVQEVKDHIKK